MLTRKGKLRWVLGIIYVIGGVLIASNAMVAGPHAFRHKWNAVITMCVVGGLLVLCGAGMLLEWFK